MITFNKIKSQLLPNIELKRKPDEISTAAKTLKYFPFDPVKDKYMKQPYLNRRFLETNLVNDESKLKALEYFSKADKEQLEQLEKLKNFGYVINKSNEIKEKGINAANKYVSYTIGNNAASEVKHDWHSESGGKKNKRTKKRRNKRKNTRRKKCKNGMSRII